MTPGPPAQAIVLYDADCGFCRWSLAKLLAWDRRARLRPLALQSEEGRGLLGDLGEEARMGSWHLIAADGTRWSGGAAAAPLLRLLPGGRALARPLEISPATADRVYSLVARNRGGIGRLVSRRALERAGERIRRHKSVSATGESCASG
ncbi:MAG: DCC1-like thiol-disulfide oxidoreductase family protein [Actinomycetota bacterium]